MSDNNQITVRGRVGTDPDIQVTPGGRDVTRFRLASTRSYRDANGEWRDADTEWFTVKAWGRLATAVQDSVRRGIPVIVQGVFSCEEWTSGEQQRSANVITATAVGVDVRHGLVKHFKVTRLAAEDQENGGTEAPDRTGSPAPDNPAIPVGAEEGPADDDAPDADPAVAPDPVEADAWATAPAVS